MIRRYVLEHEGEIGERVVAGVIAVVYTNEREQVRGRVNRIQRRYLKEVISSQHVFLEHGKSLEALLVQGPGGVLRSLTSELAGCRGVESVSLAITTALLPALHGSEEKELEPIQVVR
ncbi:MAG: CopG family transcriptional regulator [Gemmatimonas sp.]|nr:CopG family transcriptional regulator [Gemmatimonas sp.]